MVYRDPCLGDRTFKRRIIFAYTPKAIEFLKRIPHIDDEDRHNNNCSCCWQNPEKDLCMHPAYCYVKKGKATVINSTIFSRNKPLQQALISIEVKAIPRVDAIPFKGALH
eukprot:11787910-Ditylum_brightwellii.AAC.1